MNFIFKTLDPFVVCIGGNELYAIAHTQILTYCLIYILHLRYGLQIYMLVMKLKFLGVISDRSI